MMLNDIVRIVFTHTKLDNNIIAHIDEGRFKRWYITDTYDPVAMTATFDISSIDAPPNIIKRTIDDLDNCMFYTAGKTHISFHVDKYNIHVYNLDYFIMLAKITSKYPLQNILMCAYSDLIKKEDKSMVYLMLALSQNTSISHEAEHVTNCVRYIKTLLPDNMDKSGGMTHSEGLFYIYVNFARPVILEHHKKDLLQIIAEKYSKYRLAELLTVD